ncbi:2-keto-4-pentenoate hydratase [Novosphingobium sp. ST904]|uniref:2-keto-4-pentenoate hydratase n=1 Tax=Novosphingobium sp. ST904 TaxID=1684385 RepID=UPI0006C8C322|nr:2-keto-4-pentenoate hydratase [Novosphingobium sp. ST904]KPH60807.1 2-keto-4-pentenoate hydratase [Novosphingobium sp. ST904]TCM38350.1 2-keto-4-pentenoate hydratase [Novosphingobium sp. ST904]
MSSTEQAPHEQAHAVASAFVAARREKRALTIYPGEAPTDLSGAYAIQDRAIGLDGRTVAGWKVGRINAPEDARLGANRLSGPIFADSVVTASSGEAPEMPVFAEGFAAAEAEFLLHVAPGWNGTVPADDAETRKVLDAVHIGIEVASSPYPGINADGPPVTISDFGNNAGMVVGPALEGWETAAFETIGVRFEIEGETIAEATTATMLDGPLGAVRFLLANLSARGIDCSGGTWVSTGAVTGVHPVVPGQGVTAHFEGHGSVSCRIAAAVPA